MENTCKMLLSEALYEYGFYVWEKDKYTGLNHSHLLIKTIGDCVSKIYQNIKGYTTIKVGFRETIYKKEVEKSVFKDEIIKIPYSEFSGTKGTVHVESVIGATNSAYYITKMVDYGVNSGFIYPEL